MLKVASYTIKGVKSQETLPKEYDSKPNLALLAQAVRVYEDRSHTGSSKVKTRAEVDKTKKKLYKQKGTGGARHGSKGAPIFVGGGVAHGPKVVSRELNLSINDRRRALKSAISKQAMEGKLILVDGLAKLTKTKEAQFLLTLIAKDINEKVFSKVTFIVSSETSSVGKYLRNLKNVEIVTWSDLSAYQVLFGGLSIFDKTIFKK